MPVIDLGKVVGDPGASLRYRGEWSSGSEYFNNASYVDTVTHNGSLWICKTTNTGQAPAEGAYWGLGARGMAEEILVFSAHSAFPVTGDEDKLYIDNTVNPSLMYIWNGSSYVPAGGGGKIAAEDISYDNESSGLTAQTAQAAIDENAEAISSLNSRTLMVYGVLDYQSWNYINFPEGCTKQNTIILNMFMLNDGTIWEADMDARLTQFVNNENQFEVFIPGNRNQIGIKTGVEANDGKTLAIVLFKLS